MVSEKQIEALKDVLAHLVAAHSLLSRSPKTAAASNKMFDQMLADYQASIDRGREALTAAEQAALEPAEPATDAEPYLWLHPWNGSTNKYRSAIASVCPKDGPQPIPLYTHPPESRLRDALEKIARGLSLTFISSPTKMSGNEAQAIARAALAQGADDERS